MSKRDKLQTAMNWIAGAAGLYFAGITIAGAIKRKRENSTANKIKSIVSGIGTTTETGNTKTTIRDAWRNREFKNEAWVIFKDVAEPNENLVWIIDGYDRTEKKYSMYKWADVNHWAYAKGDRVCYTGFTF